MSIFLAALRDAVSTPAPPSIHDIAPPLDPPFPLWLKIAIGVGIFTLLVLAIWGGVRLAKRKPVVPPITPRAAALRELEQLRAQVQTLAPYDFSIAVSDVLRRFVDAQFLLRAGKQTSPEFLASIQQSTAFSDGDRRLLADFLERCDLIKFARVDANSANSEALLESAVAFVQGGAA